MTLSLSAVVEARSHSNMFFLILLAPSSWAGGSAAVGRVVLSCRQKSRGLRAPPGGSFSGDPAFPSSLVQVLKPPEPVPPRIRADFGHAKISIRFFLNCLGLAITAPRSVWHLGCPSVGTSVAWPVPGPCGFLKEWLAIPGCFPVGPSGKPGGCSQPENLPNQAITTNKCRSPSVPVSFSQKASSASWRILAVYRNGFTL